VVSSEAAVLETLTALKELGVRLAIDDFGTGYSSLSHLDRFPIDELKIDRSFVSQLGLDSNGTRIVPAVIGLAQALHVTTVAEGVEEAGQRDELRELGCELAQGFHFARPQPAAAVAPLLAGALEPRS
jgi:EAL domain-containing protein (putative c-di-GMP-specific phosphodiesterase class I)